MSSNNIKEHGCLNKLDRDQVQSSLAQIIRPLIPRNCSRYQYRFCELLPQPNAFGLCSDPQPFTGKIVFINEVFMLVKRFQTRNQFVIVDVSYVDVMPKLNDQVEITPYARHDFNDKRIDEPEKEINALVWMGLADLAKKRLPIVYGDLAEKLGLKNAHYNTFNRPLEQITAFCKDKELPLLSHLVVRQDTKLPPLITLSNENIQLYKEEVEKIADVDWNELQTSFEAFIKTKRKQST